MSPHRVALVYDRREWTFADVHRLLGAWFGPAVVGSLDRRHVAHGGGATAQGRRATVVRLGN
jgi:hypothetical protein